jgi:CheY-like chemotaxis protein
VAVRTALVVDDSKSARFALRKYLEMHAFSVDAVGSADEAFSYLRQQRPAVIFLDHVMPGTDGFEALRKIKSDPHTVTIPVIMCSSNEGAAFTSQARARGAADVMHKPPTAEELTRVLQGLQQTTVKPKAARQRAAAKVAPIREPGEAIGQRVMQTVRGAFAGATGTPAPPQPAAKGMLAQTGGTPEQQLSAVRDEVESLRLSVELLTQAVKNMQDTLESTVREVAGEEAHSVAERTVMAAAGRISDQLASSILATLGKQQR